jgi:hypothetical protein
MAVGIVLANSMEAVELGIAVVDSMVADIPEVVWFAMRRQVLPFALSMLGSVLPCCLPILYLYQTNC